MTAQSVVVPKHFRYSSVTATHRAISCIRRLTHCARCIFRFPPLLSEATFRRIFDPSRPDIPHYHVRRIFTVYTWPGPLSSLRSTLSKGQDQVDLEIPHRYPSARCFCLSFCNCNARLREPLQLSSAVEASREHVGFAPLIRRRPLALLCWHLVRMLHSEAKSTRHRRGLQPQFGWPLDFSNPSMPTKPKLLFRQWTPLQDASIAS